MRFALLGQPKETEGGVVTRELVMEAILCSGDPAPDTAPAPASAPPPASPGAEGKKGDLWVGCCDILRGRAGGVRLGLGLARPSASASAASCSAPVGVAASLWSGGGAGP